MKLIAVYHKLCLPIDLTSLSIVVFLYNRSIKVSLCCHLTAANFQGLRNGGHETRGGCSYRTIHVLMVATRNDNYAISMLACKYIHYAEQLVNEVHV